MSTQLVRLFTCASILSLGGLTATISVVACSSSDAAAPAGDDDDDKGDDDDTTPKKDAGSSSSSSSGSTTTDGGDDCNPIGTWTLPKPTFTVTTAGAVCDQFKAGGEKGAVATEVTITKDEKGYKALVTGQSAPLILAAADEGDCAIGGGLDPIGFAKGQGVTDADGNDIEVKLTPTQFYIFDGDKVVSKLNSHIVSVPEGAKGTPCDISQVSNGTRKK